MAKEIMRRVSPATAVARLKQMKARLERLRKNEYPRINSFTYDFKVLQTDLAMLSSRIQIIKIYHRYPERHEGLIIWAEIVLKMMVEGHALELIKGPPNPLKKGE